MPLPKSTLHLSGIALLFCAFFLSFLVSISLPYIRTMDIVRVHSPNSLFQGAQGDDLVEVRVRLASFSFLIPLWYTPTDGYLVSSPTICIGCLIFFRTVCGYDSDGEPTCPKSGHGYEMLFGVINRSGSIATTIIGSSWTRGLAIHPVGQ